MGVGASFIEKAGGNLRQELEEVALRAGAIFSRFGPTSAFQHCRHSQLNTAGTDFLDPIWQGQPGDFLHHHPIL